MRSSERRTRASVCRELERASEMREVREDPVRFGMAVSSTGSTSHYVS